MSLTPKLLQQAAAGGGPKNYIEEVFSAYLYTGDSGVRVITNDINLSGKGGLVWTKSRSTAADHALVDTARGVNNFLRTNTTAVQQSATSIAQFNNNGYNLYDPTVGLFNNSGTTYVSWTFRKQAKFFDIVTYTGNETVRTINHNLGSVPGCIMIKQFDLNSTQWAVYHRSLGSNGALCLNNSTAFSGGDYWFAATDPTSTQFTVGLSGETNQNGKTFVAYLFAHNAGGFGLTGSDNVISCGSYTGNGSTTGPTVNLGYEPQWLMVKRTDNIESWNIVDNMRGLSVGDTSTTTHSPRLRAELSNAEQASGWVIPTATGFQLYGVNAAAGSYNASGGTYIYIAIRRGPMKVPTTGTEVFSAETYDGNNTLNREFSFSMRYSDLSWFISRNYPTVPVSVSYLDRLRGEKPKLWTGGNNDESTSQANVDFANMGKIKIATLGNFSGLNESGTSFVLYNLKRTPSFFDEVCYTGTAANRTITHNLTVAPQLVIIKSRSNTNGWVVGSSLSPNVEDYMWLHLTNGWISGTFWNNTRPTSTAISLSDGAAVNASGLNFVAYLFATCPGVSKVGSYTGNGSSQTIDCGFAAGARFVLIKRTDNTGDWYTFDTARGIIAGNDPFLKINTTTAEVTAYDAVDPTSAGFIVNNDATNFPINVASATYIFLAIA